MAGAELWQDPWLLLLMILGNIAIAVYVLIQLFRLPSSATAEDFLLRRDSQQ